MNGVVNAIDKVKNIINIAIFVFVVGALALAGYFYFFTARTIKSDDGYYELSVPGKYSFKVNDKVDDDASMAQYNQSKGIYIFGKTLQLGETYNPTETEFLESINEDRTKFIESSKGKNETEVVEKELKGFKAYTYSFEYIETNNKNYLVKVFWIKSKNRIYLIDLGCPAADKQNLEKELDKILESFKELEA